MLEREGNWLFSRFSSLSFLLITRQIFYLDTDGVVHALYLWLELISMRSTVKGVEGGREIEKKKYRTPRSRELRARCGDFIVVAISRGCRDASLLRKKTLLLLHTPTFLPLSPTIASLQLLVWGLGIERERVSVTKERIDRSRRRFSDCEYSERLSDEV